MFFVKETNGLKTNKLSCSCSWKNPDSERQTRLANQNAQTEHTSLLAASSESFPADLRSFAKVEMAVLGSPSLMSPMVTVDVKQH